MSQPFRWILYAAAALFVQATPAQDTTPDALVRSVTEDVIGVIKRDKAIQAGDRQKTIALVEVRKGGIDGLINSLAAKNQQLAAKSN